MVSNLLSRLCLLKQIVGIVPRLIDRKHKLAVFVGTSARLFDFEAVEGAGMEPHIGQPNFRQPFPDLADATNDFG
jgi:hypothetical protein